MGMSMTAEQERDLFALRREWDGIYTISYTGTWRAQRIDRFSMGPDDWLTASTAAELAALINQDYAEKVLHT
jgi:hypothetical protein